ncbi:cation:proton antiporter [Vulgatibacter incomptus]|uniref:Na(+)/H(+) antiporter n=1 Tax=Vulgatibacter incomptus TaxID=1391653 RepID=A0A0K1PD48_9BACT|nr:cation:proton antiporter [Vulgatibacter incomptus]AKU91445.1 Na(+)/H(+) antiporter [Vulgatibacter incomptus]
MSLLLILLLGGLMQAARSFAIGGRPMGSGTALAFGFVLLTAFFAGRIFKQVRLPKLTGYIAAGIVIGPSVLGLVTPTMVEHLKIVNGAAIALIALTAGNELDFRSFRPLLRSVKWITLVAVVGTSALLSLAVFAVRDLLPFMGEMSLEQAIAVSLVLGVTMVAQSPAVVVALRDEMEADGPMSRTVLGVVVIADLVVILLFALVSSFAKSTFGAAGDVLDTIGQLSWEILGSLGAGLLVGVLLAVYLRKVASGAALFVVTVTFVMAEVGQRLHFDPLLVALAAGVLIRNVTKAGDRLHHEIEASSLPVYVVFFAVAGANIHLDVLAVVGIPAAIFVLVRGAGLLAGTRLGAKIAGAPDEVQRYAGMGLLPQAGLALALALLFAKTFPEFGDDAAALTLGVVALNEIIAPAIYRLALVRSGEAGTRAPPEEPQATTAAELAPPIG